MNATFELCKCGRLFLVLVRARRTPDMIRAKRDKINGAVTKFFHRHAL